MAKARRVSTTRKKSTPRRRQRVTNSPNLDSLMADAGQVEEVVLAE
jgi:hypothetical protein